ncbi:uncharacterized protein LOC131287281 [Anopheles ziemanni]|uniref:uncharacterized protein LOC131259794 n=1 Tax=Anopheles coustani TaxID=139045 RepID=UPI00265A76E2|nr:uncharacterized protein LOC131259794 [Anopheles coustani]XP_058172298.1 uncharacterized protein LOC131287281 [Anopheles ziemanni]
MNYVENLLIYVRNLSPFYVVSMVVSILVVILTAYLGLTGCVATLDDSQNEDGQQKRAEPKQNTTHKSKPPSEPIDSNTSDDSDGDASNDSDDESSDERSRRLHIESLGQLKSAKLKSIESKLTEEQRQAEKEIERAQLAAIFELLKKQTESSNLNEEDLKEQLSLYR